MRRISLLAGVGLLLSTAAGLSAAGIRDLDRDGIANHLDRDVDNDGILNANDPNIDGGKCVKGPLKGRYVGDGWGNSSKRDGNMDGDFFGDQFDPDTDGDGVKNGRDATPFGVGSKWVSFEGDDAVQTASGSLVYYSNWFLAPSISFSSIDHTMMTVNQVYTVDVIATDSGSVTTGVSVTNSAGSGSTINVGATADHSLSSQ